VTIWFIWTGDVPGVNRTTVIPKGFPAAVADPEIASAAKNAARRRLGRFTVVQASAGDRCFYITHSAERRAMSVSAITTAVSQPFGLAILR
jgi:hypothetical protein